MRGARAEFDIRVNRFKETLYPEKVSEIVGSRVDNAQSSFDRWLKFVAAAYLAVAIAAGVAAAKVPDLIRSDPSSRQQTTSITTSIGATPNFQYAQSPLRLPRTDDASVRC
jgi:hypothetical protein